MTSAATGATRGGTLTLDRMADAGAGGSTDTGAAGAGGAATASNTFDDTLSATRSVSVKVYDTANGGAGGNSTGGGAAAAAGAATSTTTVNGARAVLAQSASTGGTGG